MAKPGLKPLADLAQVVGALGVVISLIYVAVEVGQNTQALKAATFQAMAAQSVEFGLRAVDDPEYGAFFTKAALTPESMTELEQVRWNALLGAAFRQFESIQYQFSIGMLEPRMWQGYDRVITRFASLPGSKQWWADNRILYNDEFALYVDGVVE
ncbi:hypothetical protein ACGF5M_04700 [Gemmatimonadota bacterium]